MRFDSTPERAPHLNRQDQKRLLGLVGGLSFAVIAILWASRPENWHWIAPPGNEQAVNDPATLNESAPLFNPEGEEAESQDLGLVTADADDPFSSPVFDQQQEENRKATIARSQDMARQLPEEWLSKIDDHYMGLRAEEADAYYRTLAHIQRLDVDLVEKTARKDVVHANLINNPETYRGQLIALRGMARRIQPVEVNENIYGVRQAYEVWVTTDDSGSDPWRIVTTHLDARLPVGEDVAARVQTEGYFLKQFSYASQGGQHVAPLILSADVASYQVVQTKPSGTGLQPYIILFACIIGLGTVMLAIGYGIGDRRFQREAAVRFPRQDAESQKVLQEMTDRREPLKDARDTLQELER